MTKPNWNQTRPAILAVLVMSTVACGGEPAEEDKSPPPAPRSQASPATPPTNADAGSPAAPIPETLIGVWDYEQGTCDPASDMRLAISQDRFEFYESVGQVESVRKDGDAIVVDLAMEGEGETWEQSVRLLLRDDGQRLHITEADAAADVDDYPRKRCAG